jgi:hypothetical protein
LRLGALRYVVVVSYGRTGSTLLQGILMTAPNVLIRGEQGGTVGHLESWYDELCRHQSRLTRRYETSRRHPFFGIGGFRRDEALRRIRLLLVESLLRPQRDTAVIGFKENKWPDDILGTLRFLQRVFPEVRFVINTRDLNAVADSGFWGRRPYAEAVIRQRHDAVVAAADELGETAYRVHYDAWVSNPQELRGLFDWLGIRFDLQRVAEVMAQPHSYLNRSLPELETRPPTGPPPSSPCPASPIRAMALAWAAVTAAQIAALATALVGTGPFAD